MTRNEQLVERVVRKLCNDPHGAERVARLCGARVIPFQRDLIEAIWAPGVRKIAVSSGHGMGKGYSAGIIIVSWALLNLRYGGYVVVTAPTGRQAKGAPWAEAKKQFGNLLGKVHRGNLGQPIRFSMRRSDFGETRWKIGGREVAQHFTARPDDPEAFQGFHAPRLLVIIDEASGVDTRIVDAASTLVTGGVSKLVLLGNPTKSGKFEEACADGSGWAVVRASCFEHPNVMLGDEVVPGAVTREWISDRWDDHGDGTPIRWPDGPIDDLAAWDEWARIIAWKDQWWLGHVMDEFPKQGSNALITRDWVERAMKADFGAKGVRSMGVDVARYGTDLTVITIMAGRDVLDMKEYPKTSGPDAVRHIRKAAQEWGVDPRNVWIDATGIGGMGVVDWLQEFGIAHKLTSKEEDFWQYCNGVEFGGRATQPHLFLNRRAEIMWTLRARFQSGTIGLKRLPPAVKRQLMAGLPKMSYRMTPKDQYAMERKEDYKRKYRRSPDHEESLALAASKSVHVVDEAVQGDKELSEKELMEMAESLGLSVKVVAKPGELRDVERPGHGSRWGRDDWEDEEDIDALIAQLEEDPEETLSDE